MCAFYLEAKCMLFADLSSLLEITCPYGSEDDIENDMSCGDRGYVINVAGRGYLDNVHPHQPTLPDQTFDQLYRLPVGSAPWLNNCLPLTMLWDSNPIMLILSTNSDGTPLVATRRRGPAGRCFSSDPRIARPRRQARYLRHRRRNFNAPPSHWIANRLALDRWRQN